MNKINLDINEKKREISDVLLKARSIVLATCANDCVTARSMCCTSKGLEISFQTDDRFLKMQQIRENSKVAFCLSNLQVEGVAEIRGNPFKEENLEHCNLFKEKHPNSYERYAKSKYQTLVVVQPTLFTQWKYIDDKPCREFYDVEKNKAYREFYEVEV